MDVRTPVGGRATVKLHKGPGVRTDQFKKITAEIAADLIEEFPPPRITGPGGQEELHGKLLADIPGDPGDRPVTLTIPDLDMLLTGIYRPFIPCDLRLLGVLHASRSGLDPTISPTTPRAATPGPWRQSRLSSMR